MDSTRTLLRVCAASIALLAVAVAVAGWVAIAHLSRLGTATFATSTFEDTLQLTVEVTRSVRDAMSDLDQLMAVVADSSARTAQLIDDTADVTTLQIANSLETMQQAMPSLIEAGAAVDDTLSTLAILGVDYEPETSLDQAFRDIDDSLTGLADEVTRQGENLRELVPEVERVEVTTAALQGRIGDIRASLADAELLLTDYRVVLSNAQTSLGVLTSPLFANGARAVLAVIGLSGAVLATALWRLAEAPIVAPHGRPHSEMHGD